MFSIIIKISLLAVVGLFIFNGSDFHACSDDGHHEPVCEDCSCIICASSLATTGILSTDFHVEYVGAENLTICEQNIKIDEIVFELDQPPRA